MTLNNCIMYMYISNIVRPTFCSIFEETLKPVIPITVKSFFNVCIAALKPGTDQCLK